MLLANRLKLFSSHQDSMAQSKNMLVFGVEGGILKCLILRVKDCVADPRAWGLNILMRKTCSFKSSILFLICRRFRSKELSTHIY